MRHPRLLVAAVTTAAIAIGSIAAPVAAAPDPAFVIVHGIPGVRVDLCIDGEEVRSGFRYGQKVRWSDADRGRTKIVLKPERPGACRGDTIARSKTTVEPAGQRTVVARLRRGKPVLQVFLDDIIIGSLPAAYDRTAILTNATSFGTVDGWLSAGFELSAVEPTFSRIKRGQQRVLPNSAEGTIAAWVSRPGRTTSLLLPAVQQSVAQSRNHFVLVGTKKKDLRIVGYRTPLYGP